MSEAERVSLRPAAFELAHGIVYDVVTRRVARKRGHGTCALDPRHLDECCLDGFHDDVEAVVELLLASTQRITDLERWLARRARNAAIDAYRHRRGEIGALQRPRMTAWLERGLGGDPWLCRLALKILGWVGTPAGAGAPRPLLPAGPGEAEESWAGDMAAVAVEAIRRGLSRGDDPATTVVNVLRKLFVSETGAEEIACAPGDGYTGAELVSVLPGDAATLSVLVERVLAIVRGLED